MTSAGPFRHPAFFYRGEREYVAAVVPFIRDGTEAGEPVAVAVPPGNLELIRAEIGDPDPDPDPGAPGVRFLDMTQAGRNPGRIIPRVLRAFADARGSGHVRIVGEPVWPGRTPLEYPACVQHEALINAAFRGRDVTILCPYDADRLPAEALADARVTHPTVMEDSRERVSGAFSPTRALARGNEPLPHPEGAPAFDFDEGLLHEARLFADRTAARLGAADEGRAAVSLTVAELTTNSVVHGGGRGTVRLWIEEGQLVCDVRDIGLLRDPLAGRVPAPVERPGGRGLLLVNEFATLVRIHTGAAGTTVRAYFDLWPTARWRPLTI
ncbi:anti-sigma factor RsbA family regulatory protein [Streptomyces sp. NPDC051183]|uniref:anti-sigma factor RsbA family regulatory protein n=1 Tax=unclassified Streptomyces TaxID=2593676 RepID=UPI00343D2750